MLSPARDQRQTAKSQRLAARASSTEGMEEAKEWIADREGMEWIHGQNGVYGHLVSTSPPESE